MVEVLISTVFLWSLTIIYVYYKSDCTSAK